MTKEEIKANKKAYYELHREEKKAYYELHREEKKAYYELNKEKIKAYNELNREKIKANKKIYYELNREKIKANNELHKEKIKANKKIYYELNKEKIKAYYELNREKINKRQKKRLITDNLFKCKCAIRIIVVTALKRKGFRKNGKTEQILGCNFEQFRDHIEKQFKPGMNWLNHGDWHIDHKVPMSLAKTEKEVIRLSHYTNLQPLWWKENILKSDKDPNHV